VHRLILATLLGALAALSLPAPASAHAYLAVSAPADGAVLDRAPDLLVLSFTERVELPATHVDIVDADGRHWATTSVAVRPHDAAAGNAGTESAVDVVAGLPVLPANTYHIAWRTLSSDDLHVTSGTLVFGVQRQVTAAGAVPGPGGPGTRETVLRGLGLLGLCTLVGGAALALVAAGLARSGGAALCGRLLRVAAAGGTLALLTVPVQLAVQTSAGTGALLLHEATSGRGLARELGPAVLLGLVVWARRGIRAGQLPVVLAIGGTTAVLSAWGTALSGHSSPGGGLLGTLVGGVHVLAAGAWAGSVLAAAVALVPVLRTEPAQVRQILRTFAILAASCVALLTVTGLLMVGNQVATVDALLLTPYGRLLIAKVVAVAVAGLLGLRTFRRLRRRDGTVPRRGLLAEALVLGVVVILAGALASAGPARGPRFPANLPVAAEPQVTGHAADLVDTLQIRPNRPGRNVVSITVADTRRPAPAPLTGVSVQLVGPDGTQKVHPVTRTADGWTVAVDDIRSPGDWKVSVTVLRDGLPPVTDGHRWVVAPANQSGVGVVVSAAVLRPVVTWLAVLVAGAATLSALVLRYRRRRSAVPAPPPPAPVTEQDGGTRDTELAEAARAQEVTSALRRRPVARTERRLYEFVGLPDRRRC
jgi:copper transport protein